MGSEQVPKYTLLRSLNCCNHGSLCELIEKTRSSQKHTYMEFYLQFYGILGALEARNEPQVKKKLI